jgi:hypothetical protein
MLTKIADAELCLQPKRTFMTNIRNMRHWEMSDVEVESNNLQHLERAEPFPKAASESSSSATETTSVATIDPSLTVTAKSAEVPIGRTFDDQLVGLCRLLEKWRKASNAEPLPDPHDFPDPEWRPGGYGIAFLALGEVAIVQQSRLNYVQDIPTLLLYICLLAICGGASIVLVLHASGLLKRQFWQAIRRLFRKTDNYPFTQLIRTIERDIVAAGKLTDFPDNVVAVAHERIGAEEIELRDRIAIFVGQPSVVVLGGLLGGAWASWKSYNVGAGVVEILLFLISIGLFTFTVYGFRLRVALLELTRCRGMLSLEIARRKARAL